MKNYKVTFKSHNASNPIVLIEATNLEVAEAFFNALEFDSNMFDLTEESEIELAKFNEENEIQNFTKGESKIQPEGGWIIKHHSI